MFEIPEKIENDYDNRRQEESERNERKCYQCGNGRNVECYDKEECQKCAGVEHGKA